MDNGDPANSSVDIELWRVSLLAPPLDLELALILDTKDGGPEEGGGFPRRGWATAGDELFRLAVSGTRSGSVLGVILDVMLGVADRLVNVDVFDPGCERKCPVDDGVVIFDNLVERRITLCGEEAKTIEGVGLWAARFRLGSGFRSVGIDECSSGRLEVLASFDPFG